MSKTCYKVAKRTFDILLATLIWIITSPFMLIIAIIIKLSDGGDIFASSPIRIAKNKYLFMYKFRTMHTNGDENLKNENPILYEQYLENHKLPLNADPRVTRIGKFLRRTDLDELPQVINVIMGNMSIVGPRPYHKWEIDKIVRENDPIAIKNIKDIETVKPGMTGLWQVSGRNRLKLKERLELDALYARNQSIWLDLRIILKTPYTVISGKGRI